MRKFTTLTLAVIALFQVSAFAQRQSTVLLFDYKTSQLTAEHKAELKKLYDFFKSDSIGVKADAYCDSVGGPDYNLGLGEERGNNVLRYFTSKKVKADNVLVVNHGIANPAASNATEEGRKINRRVVVEVWSTKKGAVSNFPKLNQDSIDAELRAQFCKMDTMVQLPNGVMFKMNRCEFENIKNCVSINSFNTPTVLRKSGYTTMGSEMTPLISAGIVEIKLCGDSCLTNPLQVLIPIASSCSANSSFKVWKGYSNLVWGEQGEEAKAVTVEGEQYYQLETKCNVAYNLAVTSVKNTKFKFKAKKGVKFSEIRISYDCGMAVYRWSSDKPVKKAKILMPCPKGDVSLEVYGVLKDGTQVRMDYVSASNIKSKGKQKLCSGISAPKKFYIFPTDFK